MRNLSNLNEGYPSGRENDQTQRIKNINFGWGILSKTHLLIFPKNRWQSFSCTLSFHCHPPKHAFHMRSFEPRGQLCILGVIQETEGCRVEHWFQWQIIPDFESITKTNWVIHVVVSMWVKYSSPKTITSKSVELWV